MKNFILSNKNLIILWVLCAVALLIFCGHYSNTLLDIGREIYYPEQILKGKLLYKDLFNIYGPLSYQLNALLYKIISPNILTLYLSGCVCSFGIVSGIYILAKKFLSESLSFSIALFTIMTGICAPHLFNFTLPYSFGMLYGTIGFIYSLIFLIKFKETNLTKWLYLASLIGGACVTCKYDFILYVIVLFGVGISTKNKRVILNTLTSLVAIPALSFGILVLQGVTLTDFLLATRDVKNLVSSKSLNYFYKVQGIYFSPQVILLWIINLIRTLIGFAVAILGVKLINKNKLFGIVLVVTSLILSCVLTSPPVFMFLAPLTLILATILGCRGNLSPEKLCLILGALSVCAKTFFVLLPLNYGNYALPTLLIASFTALFSVINEKYQKVFALVLTAIGLNFSTNALATRLHLTTPIVTEKGVIYTHKNNAEITNGLIKILKEHSPKNALIYPEGLTVNFLANIDGTDFYNSLIPLYAESFGEKDFIDFIKKTQPEIIVLSNQNMKEYGAEYICSDYAFKICDYLSKNYTMTDNLDKGFRFVIFTRN